MLKSTGQLAKVRFWAKVEKTDSCWLWRGCTDAGGYGTVRMANRNLRTHRVAYEWEVGPIPDGLQLDHLCGVRHCVNPSHLEPVTPWVNTMRSKSFAAANAAKTHCPQGHEYTPENTHRTKPYGRKCRICEAAAQRRYQQRKRAAR